VTVAEGDAGIPIDMRKGIHSAGKDRVERHLVSGRYVMYDAVSGHLNKLKLEQVYGGIAVTGDFHVAWRIMLIRQVPSMTVIFS